MILYDNPITRVYRVNVSGYDHHTRKAFYARVNVKASSPSKAQEWLLSYPHYAKLPAYTSLECTHSYKLRKQPVWLRKAGQNNYRFEPVELHEWTAQH